MKMRTISLSSQASWVITAITCILLPGCAGMPKQDGLPSCKTPLDPAVQNSCVVTPQALWRGAKPDTAAAARLIELDVKTIVNLEWLHDDLPSFQDAVVPPIGRREIDYFRVRDWEPLVAIAPGLLDEHVAHFLAITRTQARPIYVHCRAGKNRTGVMVAAYRVFNGTPVEDAIAEMGRYGGEWFTHDARYIRSLTPTRRAALEKRIEAWIPRLQRDAQIVCTDTGCALSPVLP
jgi:Tyrosine phosphatase family